MSRRVLLATRSAGKLRELRPMFAAAGVDAVGLDEAGLPEEPAEEGLEIAETFEENALIKARWFFERAGIPAVADDSGIVIAALGGAPGVRSKRWSGQPLHGQALDDANNALLLARLAGSDDRRARYVCAAAFVNGTRELVERGETRGIITREPRGNGGFGYDPYFESVELGRTFGEVSLAEKAGVSHRSRAFAALLRRLAEARHIG